MINPQASIYRNRWVESVSVGLITMSNLINKIAVEEDHRAFQEIFAKYGPRVKGYLIKHGADNASAEELVQETMLTVWRKAALFDSNRGSVDSWVYTIARNLRIDRLRKEKVWQELPEEHNEKASDEIPVDEAISQNQIIEKIRSVLRELPDEQKEILELSYLKGLSQSEISARLELPLGTVKSRMRLAYKKIRLSTEALK